LNALEYFAEYAEGFLLVGVDFIALEEGDDFALVVLDKEDPQSEQ
jgi:hypothetical protein